MSAYVVQDETINRIATLAHAITLGSAYDHTRYAGQALLKAAGAGKRCPSRADAELGAALLAMHCRAVDARYGPGGAATFRSLDYQYRHEMASRIVVYKAVGCVLYQCAEGDVPNAPRYQALEAFGQAIAADIVEAMPEYDRAPWG